MKPKRNWIIALCMMAACMGSFSYAFAQTSTTTSPDNSALIKQLQEIIKSLQAQILELKTQIKATGGEIETVKTEVKALKLTRALSRGATGDDVRQLQQFLSSQFPDLYPEGLITGYFGPATEAAVKKFQEKNGIDSIGIVGPKTLSKLNELITQGAGESGKIPPGLLTAPGLERELSTGTPPVIPPGLQNPSITASGTIPAILATTTGSTSPSIIPATPAVPATPAQPTSQTGVPTVPAIPAQPAQPAQISNSTTDAVPPSAPLNLTATSSYYWLYLNWSKSTDNVGVVGYKIYKSGTLIFSAATSSSLTALTFQDNNLVPGTAYSYAVAAYDAAGNVSAQSVVSVTTLALVGTSPSPSPSPSASPSPTATTTASTYGSALDLSSVSNLFGKIWGPGSNGIILGGGLNFSTKIGIGWSQQYGGLFVTSYSIQGSATQYYLTQSSPITVLVTGPAGSIIEVWDLESMTVVAKNITAPGSAVVFTAQPNHRYGGFAWYADNSQKDIAIFAAQSAPDTTPPIISNIQATASSTGAIITLTTNETTDSQVEYGLTTAYGSAATLDISLGVNHTVSITGLTAGTTYHYRVKSVDAAGNRATSGDQTFTTLVPPDTTPPTFSNTQAVNITDHSATITWVTNEPATSQLGYGYSGGTSLFTPKDETLVANHSMNMSGLNANTSYNYRAYSIDAAGNIASNSLYTFTTLSSAVATCNSVDLEDDPQIGSNFSAGDSHTLWLNGKGLDISGTPDGIPWSTKMSGGAGQSGVVIGFGSPNFSEQDQGISDNEILAFKFLNGSVKTASVTVATTPSSEPIVNNQSSTVVMEAYNEAGTLLASASKTFTGVTNGVYTPASFGLSAPDATIKKITIRATQHPYGGVYIEKVDFGASCSIASRVMDPTIARSTVSDLATVLKSLSQLLRQLKELLP